MSVIDETAVLEKVCCVDVERERIIPLVSGIVIAQSFWMVWELLSRLMVEGR
jgi:hypothetical protein